MAEQDFDDVTEDERSPLDRPWFRGGLDADDDSDKHDTQFEKEKLALRDVFRDMTTCYCTVRDKECGVQRSGSILSDSPTSLRINKMLGKLWLPVPAVPKCWVLLICSDALTSSS